MWVGRNIGFVVVDENRDDGIKDVLPAGDSFY